MLKPPNWIELEASSSQKDSTPNSLPNITDRAAVKTHALKMISYRNVNIVPGSNSEQAQIYRNLPRSLSGFPSPLSHSCEET